jgi:hypothetical protein
VAVALVAAAVVGGNPITASFKKKKLGVFRASLFKRKS